MSKSRQWQRGSAAGTLITVVLVGLLIGLGIWLIGRDAGPGVGGSALFADADAPEPVEPLRSLPSLASAAPYVPRDSIIDVDISEYAGYAGLVVANGGLQPNPDSLFAREYGFQVRLTLNEEEGWSKVNNGQVAASVTTADVLAVLGRQFDVKVPAQIAFSRGGQSGGGGPWHCQRQPVEGQGAGGQSVQ